MNHSIMQISNMNDLAIFEYPQLILTIAKTKSGKTTFFRYMLQYLYAKKIIVSALVFCSTIFNGDYDFINKKRHYLQLDEKIITALMNYRAKQMSQGTNPPGIALGLDDCVSDKEINGPCFQSLVSKARHLNIHLFISIQHAKVVGPLIRDNAGLVLLFKQQTPEQINYASEIVAWPGSKQEFAQFMNDNIADYKCLVVNRNEPSNDKKKIFKIMRAPKEVANFIIP